MSRVEELEGFLRAKFDEVVASAKQPSQEMPITEPFSEWEATNFLRGVRENLFEIDDQGYVQSAVLPPPAGNSDRQRMLQLFWNHSNDTRRLYREGVNQLSTAARLIFDYGWDKSEVRMEPTTREFGDLAYGVDIMCLAPGENVALCCENKHNSYELRKLKSHFEGCVDRGPHSKDECENPANHAKYEFCVAARPSLAWFVAPAEEVLFSLSFSGKRLVAIERSHAPLDRDSVIAHGNTGL